MCNRNKFGSKRQLAEKSYKMQNNPSEFVSLYPNAVEYILGAIIFGKLLGETRALADDDVIFVFGAYRVILYKPFLLTTLIVESRHETKGLLVVLQHAILEIVVCHDQV